MTTTTDTRTLRALRITAKKPLENISIDIDHTRAIEKSIGCRTFDIVGLDDDIDLFIDDEGFVNGSPLNLKLTTAAHTLGTPSVLYGTALVLGLNPETGETISLTDTQIQTFTKAHNTEPTPEIIDRCLALPPGNIVRAF